MNNNKIFKSILYKEIENKVFHLNKVTKLSSFWKVKNISNAHDLYNNFFEIIESYGFCEKISCLSKPEADVLELIFNSDGVITRAQIVSSLGSEYSIDIMQQTVSELISKFFIYERKSLNNLSMKSFKYIIYEEIYERLKKLNFISFSKKLLPSLPHRFSDYLSEIEDGLDKEIKKCIYSNNGYITLDELKKIKNDETQKIKAIENKALKLFLMKFDKIMPVYIPQHSEEDITNIVEREIKETSYAYYDWVYYLGRIFLYLKETNLSYTQKGVWKKLDYENMLQLCDNKENILNTLLDLMFELKLIIEENYDIEITQSYRVFLEKNLEDKFRKILNLDIFEKVVSYLKKIPGKEPFSIYDLLREISKEKQEFEKYSNQTESTENFKQVLLNMYHLGLLNKVENSRLEEYTFTEMVNKLLLREINKLYHKIPNKEEKKGNILVNRDFSIIMYPEKLSNIDRLTLLIFTEEMSHTEVITRRITKKSIQQAVYLGYQLDDFLNLLEGLSKIKPDEQIFNYCREWENNLKRAYLKQIYVIEAEEDIIETIELDPEINIGYKKRIGKNHIMIEKPEKILNNLGLDNIYIYKQEEDFD